MKKFIVYIIVLLCGIGVFFLQFKYERNFQPYTFYQVYLDGEKIGVIESKEELEKYIANQGNVIREQVENYNVDLNRIKAIEDIMRTKINRNSIYYKNFAKIIELEKIYNQLNKYVDYDGNITGNYEELSEYYLSLDPSIISETSLTNKKITNYEHLKNNLDQKIREYKKDIVNYFDANKDNLNLTSSQYSYLEEYVKNNLIEVGYTKYIYMLKYVEDNEIYLKTKDIYEPLGLSIKKINTYVDNSVPVKEIYNNIIDKKPCTIEGYQFRIKVATDVKITPNTMIGATAQNDYNLVSQKQSNDEIIYVTDPKIFEESVEEAAAVFIGREAYEAYKNNTQKAITSTGSIITNLYLREEITIKQTNISVKEKIYSDKSSLASYLLYGDTIKTSIVKATSTDTIDEISYRNGISVEEFFLSNPSFTSVDNILYDGQPITITKLNPKLSIIVEESQVQDMAVKYNVIEKYDSSMTVGSEYVEQKGENGVMRVSQKVQKINGAIVSVENGGNETIKASKDKIVRVGTKVVPHIGSVKNWGWPTNAYAISSRFGYRIDPFTGRPGAFHAGVDIPNKYRNPVYASNNGTIVTMRKDRYNYGTHIIIDHNNGYWSVYGHMSGFAKGLKVGSVVSRGQTIGYIGSTGASTGNHVHFEIRVGQNRYSCATNPLPYLRK